MKQITASTLLISGLGHLAAGIPVLHSSQKCWMGLQLESLWSWLCAWGHCHNERHKHKLLTQQQKNTGLKISTWYWSNNCLHTVYRVWKHSSDYTYQSVFLCVGEYQKSLKYTNWHSQYLTMFLDLPLTVINTSICHFVCVLFSSMYCSNTIQTYLVKLFYT